MIANAYKSATRGAIIGLLGGIFTGAAMLLFLILYSIVLPAEHLGSTAALAPFVGGIGATVYGVALGAVLGWLAERKGFEVRGMPRCLLFGMALMGAIGLLWFASQVLGTPERALAHLIPTVGLTVVSNVVGGSVGGILVGMFSRKS